MSMEKLKSMCDTLETCAGAQLAFGTENVDTHEMGEVIDMIKDLMCAMKDCAIVKAMEEDSKGYEEYVPELRNIRGYNSYRYADGRYAPKGRGRYAGYDEPDMSMSSSENTNGGSRMYTRMQPEMYHDYDYNTLRDMDRKAGRLYYTEQTNRVLNQNRLPDVREGRSGMARRTYIESKAGGNKNQKMSSLEDYMKDLSTDVTEMIVDASPEEKEMLKTKMKVLIDKIQ